METSIVIVVDDKDKMIDALQSELSNGEDYAGLCIKVLIDDWGADPAKINRQRIIEGATGHLIHCKMKGLDITPAGEYVSDNLDSYSDIGLAECGLTREQYKLALMLYYV